MIEESQPLTTTNGAPDLKALVEAFILVSDGPISVEALAEALQVDVSRLIEG